MHLDRRLVLNDLAGPPLLPLPHHPSQRTDEIPDVDITNRDLGRPTAEPALIDCNAGEPQLPVPGSVLEEHGSVPVLLVFQQPRDELFADRLDSLLCLLGPRHEFTRLDLQKQAGEIDKFPDLVDGEILEHVEIGDKLFGDLRERHLCDVYLVPLYEVEQQVHRPGEHVEGDLEFHARLSPPRSIRRATVLTHRHPSFSPPGDEAGIEYYSVMAVMSMESMKSMETLWAPWRLGYVQGHEKGNPPEQVEASRWRDGAEPDCFLCRAAAAAAHDDKTLGVVDRTAWSVVVTNRFPYSNGHLLIAPLDHRATLAALVPEQLLDLQFCLVKWCGVMEHSMQAHGFNIGLNLGAVAGAGLPGHLHWHIVPRWPGDINFMPTVAGARVLPQSLDTLWEQLVQASPHAARHSDGAAR